MVKRGERSTFGNCISRTWLSNTKYKDTFCTPLTILTMDAPIPLDTPQEHTVEEVRFKTYALTVRPRDGITEQQLGALATWIRKRSDHYHIVTEKTASARHVHAALYLKVAVSRSNFVVVFARLLKQFGLDFEEMAVAKKGVKILYNNDFVTCYLNKGDDTVVVASSLPEVSRLDAYYPPKPEVASRVSRTEQHSKYYWHLESLWHKHVPPTYEVHTLNARDFLFRMMYHERCLPVIKDDRQIIQVARHLTRWLNRVTTSTIELPAFEKEE